MYAFTPQLLFWMLGTGRPSKSCTICYRRWVFFSGTFRLFGLPACLHQPSVCSHARLIPMVGERLKPEGPDIHFYLSNAYKPNYLLFSLSHITFSPNLGTWDA